MMRRGAAPRRAQQVRMASRRHLLVDCVVDACEDPLCRPPTLRPLYRPCACAATPPAGRAVSRLSPSPSPCPFLRGHQPYEHMWGSERKQPALGTGQVTIPTGFLTPGRRPRTHHGCPQVPSSVMGQEGGKGKRLYQLSLRGALSPNSTASKKNKTVCDCGGREAGGLDHLCFCHGTYFSI